MLLNINGNKGIMWEMAKAQLLNYQNLCCWVVDRPKIKFNEQILSFEIS